MSAEEELSFENTPAFYSINALLEKLCKQIVVHYEENPNEKLNMENLRKIVGTRVVKEKKDKVERPQCEGRLKNGDQCKSKAVEGSLNCSKHNNTIKQTAPKAAAVKGGATKTKPNNFQVKPIKTINSEAIKNSIVNLKDNSPKKSSESDKDTESEGPVTDEEVEEAPKSKTMRLTGGATSKLRIKT